MPDFTVFMIDDDQAYWTLCLSRGHDGRTVCLGTRNDQVMRRLQSATVPSASGKGQVLWRCADCGVTVWSNYPQAGPSIHFIRVGTLDDPSRVPPDIHIYTSTKQLWVVLPDGVPAVAEFYRPADYWPVESTARFKAARAAAG